MEKVDTNLPLTSLDVSESGEVLIGGSEGALFYKAAGGAWQDVSVSADELVHYVNFKKRGMAEVIVSSKDKVRILRRDSFSAVERWREINSFDSIEWASQFAVDAPEGRTSSSKYRRINGVSLTEVEGKSYIIVGMSRAKHTYMFAQTWHSAFSYNPSSWFIESAEKTPNQLRTIDAGVEKLDIEFPGFWSWSGKAKFYRRADNKEDRKPISSSLYSCGKITVAKGATCSNGAKLKSEHFWFLSAPWFKNDQEAIALASFSDYSFWSDKRSSETKMLSTSDGGESWDLTENAIPEEYCNYLITEVKDRLLLFCNGASGDFYESFDDGETWEQVRQRQNF